MLEPKLVLGEHVLRAELAALPVDALPESAEVPADVLIALLEFEGQSALPAGREHVCLLAAVEQVVGELPDVDVPPAFLAASQQLAFIQVV